MLKPVLLFDHTWPIGTCGAFRNILLPILEADRIRPRRDRATHSEVAGVIWEIRVRFLSGVGMGPEC